MTDRQLGPLRANLARAARGSRRRAHRRPRGRLGHRPHDGEHSLSLFRSARPRLDARASSPTSSYARWRIEGELIGAVGYLPRADDSAEIGYWIGKPWWGRGFATEAASRAHALLLLHGCACRGSPAVIHRQSGSEHVIAKLGFKPVGTCSAWCDARNAEVETMVYERQRPRMALLWRRAA